MSIEHLAQAFRFADDLGDPELASLILKFIREKVDLMGKVYSTMLPYFLKISEMGSQRGEEYRKLRSEIRLFLMIQTSGR
jgi:hypothetical protein